MFDVTVDGQLLYSKHDTGRHANKGEIVDLFAAAYADGAAVYGT